MYVCIVVSTHSTNIAYRALATGVATIVAKTIL